MKHQQGLSILLVLFILLVLGMLGTTMVRIQNAGTESSVREVLSTRALLAASSGAERRLNLIFPPGGVSNPAACINPDDYDFPALAGCALVRTTCTTAVVDANYFTIRSVGRCGPAGQEAVRTVVVQATDG